MLCFQSDQKKLVAVKEVKVRKDVKFNELDILQVCLQALYIIITLVVVNNNVTTNHTQAHTHVHLYTYKHI